ncbi:hypothetical protein RFI_13446, partial [Reticulomyxa filosa]
FELSENTTKYNRNNKKRLEGVVASMSRGPVQIGDQNGFSDVPLIMQSCTKGGRLLRPSQTVSAIDRYFLFLATKQNGPTGEVYSTHSEFVYIYLLSAGLLQNFELTISDVYHHQNQNGMIWNEFLAYEWNTSSKYYEFSQSQNLLLTPNNLWTFQYFTFIPVDSDISNGWYLQGEIDKWISVSPDRFQSIEMNSDGSIEVVAKGDLGEQINVAFVNVNTLQQVIQSCVIGESLVVTIRAPSFECA